MNRFAKLVAAGCAIIGPALPAWAAPADVAADLLAAERAFSIAAAQADLPDGLAAMFDDTIVMPLPNGSFATSKADALAALAANPANQGARAEWAPVRAGISADGQHGFTFGYMTIHKAGAPDRQAKYLAYWVKQPEGWRVAAYKRAPKPEGQGTAPMAPLLPAKLVAPAKDPALVETLGGSLAAAEKAFSDEAQTIGLGAAFRKNGRADAMNMGREAAFRIGAEAIGGNMGSDPVSPVSWSADGALVASSGDLGVTWGMIRANAPPAAPRAAIPFFTIWYRPSPSDPWRYVAE